MTAHLGGGVGKALSGLVEQAVSSGSAYKHTIVTLEAQEKPQFIEQIRNCGCEVITCPPVERLHNLIKHSDIIQLEWWNHPATLKMLCSQPLPSMRLLVWSHVSGLYNPIIPAGLISAAQQFLFTSACSLESKEVKSLPDNVKNRLAVVSSSGGFDGLPLPAHRDGDRLAVGYIGSLNFAKLHPRFVDFLNAVNIPGFRVRLIGDTTNRDVLELQCKAKDKPELLEFIGYKKDIASELSAINVLAYLLNPEHYGTTENALIEAMAMGIVPVVLNNPAERLIVKNRQTGIIVNSPDEFAEALDWLSENPNERERIGKQAAQYVREKFTAEKMITSFNTLYSELMTLTKKHILFTDIFGLDPSSWFLSCQEKPHIFTNCKSLVLNSDGFSVYGLLEQTKGTVFHFHKYFNNNPMLSQWAKELECFAIKRNEHE
ncbi:MAG: glycosyltransferase family 4 protein [Clostridiales bacterium]|nr:glycosyltransferase family 4 protein [Clostridiales bacterium]